MPATPLQVPLCLGPLAARGYELWHTGIRWLCDDGHLCRPGELIASCFLRLQPAATDFVSQEGLELRNARLQVYLAPRVAGRLVQARGYTRGGYLDLNLCPYRWSETTCLGTLECQEKDVAECRELAHPLRHLMYAGRHSDVHLPGQFPSGRAWWSDTDEPFGTVLSLGICEQRGLLRGDGWPFAEFFACVPGPTHAAYVPDNVVVPSVSVLSSQLDRTPAERDAIVADLARTFAPLAASKNSQSDVIPDWLRVGWIVEAVCRSPLLERNEVLSANGIQTLGPADAAILSLNSESCTHFRHKRLGYVLSFHDYQLVAMGPLLRHWLQQEFAVFRKTLEEVHQDFLKLIDRLGALTQTHLLILNSVASSTSEDCFCYAPFDKPLGNTLANVRAMERNLMLFDLARQRDISIVDFDSLTAELGSTHLPDGVHPNGPLQDALREQIVTILRERGLPGFGPQA